MQKLVFDLTSLEKTDDLARKIATHLFPGAILLLWGGMGNGKTTFAKSICAGLGILPEIVSSPTYTIVNIYPGKLTVFHVDLYRLTSPEDLDDFDREDLISFDGVSMIEWPEFILSHLSDCPTLNLSFKTITENHRQLTLESEYTDFDILFNTLEQENLSSLKNVKSLGMVVK